MGLNSLGHLVQPASGPLGRRDEVQFVQVREKGLAGPEAIVRAPQSVVLAERKRG